MSPKRATLLVLLAAVVAFAGCTATPVDDGGTAAPVGKDGTATTRIETPESCGTVRRTTTDPVRPSVEPSAYPERPATWNESSVESYVVAVERAYSRNGALRKESTRVEVIVSDVSVSKAGDAWVVRLTSTTNTWEQGTPDGTATATVVHGDGGRIPVTYRLTERGLYRTETADYGSPSATAERTAASDRGVPVVCFGG